MEHVVCRAVVVNVLWWQLFLCQLQLLFLFLVVLVMRVTNLLVWGAPSSPQSSCWGWH